MAETILHDRPRNESGNWFTTSRVALVTALLLFLSFPLVLLNSRTFFYRDFGVLAFPVIQYHHDAFWRGEFPLWNPYSNSGAPFFAQWGTMAAYPFSLLYLLLPLPWSINFFSLIHLVLAAVGMFLLALRWSGRRDAAALSAFIFVFNGATLSGLTWPNYCAAIAWMPWVVYGAEKSWKSGGVHLVIAGFLGAFQLLVGVPELVLMTWLVVLGTLLAQREWITRKTATRLLLVILIVAGLTAVQVLPFLDLLGHSQRDRAFATAKWAMPAWGPGNLFVPLLHNFTTPQGTMFQWSQEFLPSYYLGLIPLALASLAGFRSRLNWLWICLILSLVLAMGPHGYLYNWIRRLLPVLGVGRYPVKFVFLLSFLLALMAGSGFAAFLRSLEEKRPASVRRIICTTLVLISVTIVVLALAHAHPFPYDRWELTRDNTILRLLFLAGGMACLCFFTSRQPPKCHGALAGLIALLWFDAITHHPLQNPTIEPIALKPGFWQTFLKSPPPSFGEARIFITPQSEDALLLSEVPDLKKEFALKRFTQWSHLNLIDRIAKVNGSSTLQLKQQAEIQKWLYQTNEIHPAWLSFLNVGFSLALENNQAHWLPSSNCLPLLHGGCAPIFIADSQTLAAVTQEAFDPTRQVLLPQSSQRLLQDAGPATVTIRDALHQPGYLAARVLSDRPAILTVAQSYSENWRAEVDGKPAPLFRANHAFQGVAIPAGEHRVAFIYQEKWFRIGACISLVTLFACSAAWVKMRRPPPGQDTQTAITSST